jgi:hypothetical protein
MTISNPFVLAKLRGQEEEKEGGIPHSIKIGTKHARQYLSSSQG